MMNWVYRLINNFYLATFRSNNGGGVMPLETVFHHRAPYVKCKVPFRPCFWKGYMEGGIKQEEKPFLCLHQQDITDHTRSDTLPYLGQHHLAFMRKSAKHRWNWFFYSSVIAASFGFMKYFILLGKFMETSKEWSFRLWIAIQIEREESIR